MKTVHEYDNILQQMQGEQNVRKINTFLRRLVKSWGCDFAMSPICRAAVNLVAWVEPALKVWLKKSWGKINNKLSKFKDKENMEDTVQESKQALKPGWLLGHNKSFQMLFLLTLPIIYSTSLQICYPTNTFTFLQLIQCINVPLCLSIICIHIKVTVKYKYCQRHKLLQNTAMAPRVRHAFDNMSWIYSLLSQ